MVLAGRIALVVVAILALGSFAQAQDQPRTPERVPLISPWIDHHDRIAEHLSRLSPPVDAVRFDIERSGGKGSLEWLPAFGFPTEISLDGDLVILENAPLSALKRLHDSTKRPLNDALLTWVRNGGHLLIVGGSPSLESYRDSALEVLMGFRPNRQVSQFKKKQPRKIRGGGIRNVHVDYLHRGELRGAKVLLTADRNPFLIENRIGKGRVTTLLSGAQGQRRRDGGEEESEWFASPAWAEELRRIVREATGRARSLLDQPPAPPNLPLAPIDGFDIRFFSIGNQPFPFSYAAGEAYERARSLRKMGFTSTVFYANPHRDLDDRRVLHEIVRGGLQIVYYDGIRRETGRERFPDPRTRPKRAHDRSGKDLGWDVHDPNFRVAPLQILQNREYVHDLPLRALQLIEEFKDGSAIGPAAGAELRRKGIPQDVAPGDARWFEGMEIRANATAETFQAFREDGQRLLPGLPQSTYWPGSYWSRPFDYEFKPSALADAVDELLGPGYGYNAPGREEGPASVRRSATEAWSALHYSQSSKRHMAVYAMGRPITRRGLDTPNFSTWVETTWTALAHGATGLAYWSLPKGSYTEKLGPFHREIARLGPWLRPVSRTPAPVALLESWTSRGEAGDRLRAGRYSKCLQRTLDALERGFQDVDTIFEENVSEISDASRVIVIVSSPTLSEKAAQGLVSFLERGGHLLVEPGSAIRTQPGGRPFDLARESGAPERIHPVPLGARCEVARFALGTAATTWRASLDDLGITPRVVSSEPETEASIRGDDELRHIYLVNHAEEARNMTIELAAPWSTRRWVELRSGIAVEAASDDQPRSLPEQSVRPGEAVVWASAARLLDRAEADVHRQDDHSARLVIVGADSEGKPVADGYPVSISVKTSCTVAKEESRAFDSGHLEIPISRCDEEDEDLIEWSLFDPLTGRRLSSENPRRSFHGSRRSSHGSRRASHGSRRAAEDRAESRSGSVSAP